MADTNNNINVEREEEYKEELRRSFDLVKPISLEAAAIFYPTLWEINPATKALFKNTDMVKQGEKLMKVLGVAVSSLRNFEALRPVMQRLGKKHIDYGVTAEMYPCVVQALLITLEKGLGEECTAETKAAWHWVMTLISGVCIEAAREVDPTYGDEKTSEDDATSAANGEKQGEAGEGEGGAGTTSAVGVTVTVTTTTTTTQEKNKTVEATSDAKEAVEEPLADAEANAAVVGAPERSDD